MAAPVATVLKTPTSILGTQADGTATPVLVDPNGAVGYTKLGASVSATYTPAATSHTGLDSIGGAKTMVFTGMSGRLVYLTGYSFSIDTTTPITTVMTAFLYNATPAVIADDAAYAVVSADIAKFMDTVAIAQTVDYTSTAQFISGLIARKPIQLVTDTATVYLQLTTTATLEAVAHKLTLYYES